MNYENKIEKFFDSYNIDESRAILGALNYVNQNVLASEWNTIKKDAEYLIEQVEN